MASRRREAISLCLGLCLLCSHLSRAFVFPSFNSHPKDGQRQQPPLEQQKPPAFLQSLASLTAAFTVLSGSVLSPMLGTQQALALTPEQNAQVGTCVLSSCKGELAQCILNPKCLANLICIQTCSSSKDETLCQIKCGDLFENETVGKFNACAVSQKKCVPQRQDDGSYPIPPKESLVKRFDVEMMEGQWYISAGLNKAFDTFDCQVHFFVSPEPGKLFAKLNWRIQEPDGEFFTRDVVQRFVQQKDNPALLLNHDNDYLHYEDDWYILDAEPNSHVLVYYRGQNDAWIGYGGAVLYTRSSTVPPEIEDRVAEALQRANLNWADFQKTDNSCKPLSQDALLLREEYAKKLFLTEEEALQQQLTAVRGFAASKIDETEKEAIDALDVLEDLRESYQNEITYDVLELEDTVGQEVNELIRGAEFEVKELKEVTGKLAKTLGRGQGIESWKNSNSQSLDRLQDKLNSEE